MPTSTDEKDQNVKQEKNDGFLPTARHGEKDEGRGEKRREVNQNDALGRRVQELYILNFRSTL